MCAICNFAYICRDFSWRVRDVIRANVRYNVQKYQDIDDSASVQVRRDWDKLYIIPWQHVPSTKTFGTQSSFTTTAYV